MCSIKENTRLILKEEESGEDKFFFSVTTPELQTVLPERNQFGMLARHQLAERLMNVR
jgi:hypothetical protein